MYRIHVYQIVLMTLRMGDFKMICLEIYLFAKLANNFKINCFILFFVSWKALNVHICIILANTVEVGTTKLP